MSAAALAASLLCLLGPAAGETAQLYLATERPFAPDTPGAVVKLEVPGARSVDVRLYRVDDPERFLAAQPDLRHLGAQDGPERPEGRAASKRAPGPIGVAGRALTEAALDLRRSLDRGLVPTARRLAARAVQGPAPAGSRGLPFLRGLTLVERWDLACGAGDAEFSYCDLDIGPRPAGAYLVEAVAGREVAQTLALFSRLALVTRRTPGTLAVLAVDSHTGQPLADVHLALLVPGQAPVRGRTSAQGLFSARSPTRGARLVGTRGSDLALVELSPVRQADPSLGTLLVTDRGEYRPGERVRFHGFARAAEGPGRLALPAPDARVEVRAYDARGSLFHTAEHALSSQGGFDGEWVLSPSLPHGLFRVVATLGGRAAGAEFAVREAPRPAFALEATLEVPAAGQPAVARLRARSAGRPLPGVQVAWRAVRAPRDGPNTPEEVDRGDVDLDDQGEAQVGFETLAGADSRYELTALGRDREGRLATSTATATVARDPVRVVLGLARKLVAPGTPVTLALAAGLEEPGGGTVQPVATDLKVRVLAARSADGPRERVLAQDVRTGADGAAALTFTPTLPGYYEVEVLGTKGRLAEGFLYVTAAGGDIPFSPEALVLVPDKAEYLVGETARVLVLAPFDAATALVTLEGAELLRQEALPIRGSSAVYEVKVGPALAPHATLSVQAVAGDQTWRVQRTLTVLPQGPALTLRGSLGADTAGPGSARLELEVVDAQGQAVAGAELFAVIRDERSVETPAPPILGFFHPTRLSAGVTASSTGYRNSSAGRPFPRAASDTVEEGYLPFKGLGQGRPRPRDEGTLLAQAALTDAKGRASWSVPVPADVARVAATVRGAAGPAFGEWAATWTRPVPAMDLSAPAFLRDGDEAVVQAGCADPAVAIVLANASADEGESASTRAMVPVLGGRGEQTVTASFEGFGTSTRQIAEAPATTPVRRATSGLAGPGRTLLAGTDNPGAGPVTLWLSPSPEVAAAGARAALGSTAERRTGPALARLLTRLAEWEGQAEVSAELRDAALADVAALVGLSHPEGTFGRFDGAAVDPELTSTALLALALAREAGLEVEDGALSRGAVGLLARRRQDPAGDLALALLEERTAADLLPRLSADRGTEASTPADRAMLAWALGELGEHTAATEVGRRLERSARLAGPFACFAETCPLEGAPRATVHATALAVLALRKVLPRSAALAPAVRYLLATRGAGGFGEDVAGGLAALALARAGDVAPLRAGPVGVEANGRPVATLARLGQREETRLEIGSGPVVLSTTGQVAWRLEQTTASREAGGELEVTRTFQALDPSGKPSARPLQAGDRVRITLSVAAAAAPATWAVRVEDPYPAGLRPIDLEGEHEQFRKLSDRALRLFLPDRVVFLLPALAEGRTVLEWEAEAVVAGHFAAAPAVVHRGGQQGQSAPTPLDVAPPPLEPRTQAGSPP